MMHYSRKIVSLFMMVNSSLVLLILAVIWAAFPAKMALHHRAPPLGSTVPQQVTTNSSFSFSY